MELAVFCGTAKFVFFEFFRDKKESIKYFVKLSTRVENGLASIITFDWLSFKGYNQVCIKLVEFSMAYIISK